jgi:hypothetical protein
VFLCELTKLKKGNMLTESDEKRLRYKLKLISTGVQGQCWAIDHVPESLGVWGKGASVDWLSRGEAGARTIRTVAIDVDKRVSATDDVAVVSLQASLSLLDPSEMFLCEQTKSKTGCDANEV